MKIGQLFHLLRSKFRDFLAGEKIIPCRCYKEKAASAGRQQKAPLQFFTQKPRRQGGEEDCKKAIEPHPYPKGLDKGL